MEIINNEALERIFADVGADYEYKRVEAKYVAFRDFKIKWIRSYDWISFEVSDYMSDAPSDVLASLCDTIYAKIRGDSEAFYGDIVCNWVSSDRFVDRNQRTYASRVRGLSSSTAGRVRDLRESYDRLASLGLIRDDPRILLGWVPAGTRRAGNSSVLMRAACMNSILDSEEVPEVVLDYCLYAYISHIQLGFAPDRKMRRDEYEAMLSRFPMRSLAENEMRRISLKI